MKKYSHDHNFADCLEAIQVAMSFAEQGEFDTAEEIMKAWERGEKPSDLKKAGKDQHPIFSMSGMHLIKKCLSILLGIIGYILIARGDIWADGAQEIRIGFFPNITHSQALLAKAGGSYEKATGMPVQWNAFNAGPSAVEALFVEAIDMTFIGPNPAINGYIKSEGKSFAIVSGGASGGAALVVREDSGIQGLKDFDGKIIATPQLGNTQDVAARAWFHKNGYKFKEKGGSLTVMPLANPDQLTMFQKKEIDGAWTVEPWVSRLVIEGGGRVLLEEKELWPGGRYVTTHLIVSRSFLKKHPAVVKKILQAHVEITLQIQKDQGKAMRAVNEQIKRETGKSLPDDVIKSAFQRVAFTWDPVKSSLHQSAQSAFEAGFIKTEPQLEGIYDLGLLNEVLQEKQLDTIQ